MQQRAIGILALAALLSLAACGGGGTTSSTSPTNVQAQAGDGFVTVTWDFAGDASRFDIYREMIGTAGLAVQAPVRIGTLEDGSAREYVDVDVDSSETYVYGVSANGGEPILAGGAGVSPDPGNVLRVLFGDAVPDAGNVTSSPPGISCGAPGEPGCEAEFATIAEVTLTAASVPGFAVTWENCPGAGANESCVVDMLTDKTVTVTYSSATTLNVNVEPAGIGRVSNVNDLGTNPDVDCEDSCTYAYPDGLIIGLSAQSLDPDNYEVEAWGAACSGLSGSTCTVTMDGSQAASVDFRLIPPTASLSTTEEPSRITLGESATLEWDVSGGGDITTGELEITITPDVGPVDTRTGSRIVFPDETEEYTLTATNASGTATDIQTVVVGNGALVDSFEANPDAINPTATSVLSWSVSGTDTAESPMTVTLEPLGEDVLDVREFEVSPGVTTEYTLVASNEFGSNSKTTTVRVGGAPTIESLAAVDPYIEQGEGTFIVWDVSGAGTISVSFEPDIGAFSGSDSAFVEPEQTTTYTMTASSDFGTDTGTVKVSVGEAPAITLFEASDERITADESSMLSWVISGTDTPETPIVLTLDPGEGDVSELTQIVVEPDASTQYTLTASSAYGETSATVDIDVGVAPAITSFMASESTITSTQSTLLSWVMSGTDTVEYPMTVTLEPLGEDVSEVLEFEVSPDVTTEYMLTASNAFGSSSSGTLEISVGEAPTITSFTATPTEVTSGDPVLLEWAVEGDGPFEYSIDQGIGVVIGTSTTVNPTSTTTYTLSASSPYGSPDTRETEVTVGVAPSVTSFMASESTITSTQSTLLSWVMSGTDTVEYPMTVTLEPLGEDVSEVLEFEVSPDVTTEYTLTASSAFGDDFDTTEVTVEPTVTGSPIATR